MMLANEGHRAPAKRVPPQHPDRWAPSVLVLRNVTLWHHWGELIGLPIGGEGSPL